ncbi:MAG: PEGA domain-containing protein [Methanoregula sp.]
MQQKSSRLRNIVICLVILGVLLSGCTTAPIPAPETGSVRITSSPTGAEIYLDNEYRGTTPATITAIPTGNHTLEVRERGYERWSATIKVDENLSEIPVALVSAPSTLPVTFAIVNPGIAKTDLPQIHVDGYWTWPPSAGTSNPSSVLVHVDSFNVGYTDAREVTVSANLYYEGRQVCWNTIYLGTLNAGSHVTKDTIISCTLPSGLNSQDLMIRFENVVVSP